MEDKKVLELKKLKYMNFYKMFLKFKNYIIEL